MNTHTHTKTVLAGISALTLLAITACSAESDASVNADPAEPSAAEEQTETPTSEPIFNFSPVADRQSSDELRIEVPQELIDASDQYSETRFFESITARATDETEAQCAIEFTFEYADGTTELIEDEDFWNSAVDFYRDGSMYNRPNMDAENRRLSAIGHPEVGAGVTNTVGTSVVETKCATAPEDVENTVAVAFRDFSEDQYGGYWFDALATVELNVMASGDITVVAPHIEGYHYSGDEHGWLSEDQTVDTQGNIIDS